VLWGKEGRDFNTIRRPEKSPCLNNGVSIDKARKEKRLPFHHKKTTPPEVVQ
jgi:hypothetical protein